MSLPNTANFAKDLRDYLIADNGVSTALGQRIYWQRAPQAPSTPFAVLSTISATAEFTHDGPVDLEQDRIQVDVFAPTKAASLTAANAIKQALTALDHTTQGDTVLEWAHFDSARWEWENESDEYRTSYDYIIYFQDAVPA